MLKTACFQRSVTLAISTSETGSYQIKFSEPNGNIKIKCINYDWMMIFGTSAAISANLTGNSAYPAWGYTYVYSPATYFIGAPPLGSIPADLTCQGITLITPNKYNYENLSFGPTFIVTFFLYNQSATYTVNFIIGVQIDYEVDQQGGGVSGQNIKPGLKKAM